MNRSCRHKYIHRLKYMLYKFELVDVKLNEQKIQNCCRLFRRYSVKTMGFYLWKSC